MNPMPSLSDETNGALAALEPGMTIGIVGGGQLGRMMALSAKYMGFRVGVLDPTDDCPTAQVADFQIVADYDDTAYLRFYYLSDKSLSAAVFVNSNYLVLKVFV